jgi:hypothetical protein
LSSVPVKQSFTVTETAIQRRGTTTISERVEKDEAGLLGSLELGFGPDSSGVITTTITHSNLAEATAQQTLQVDVLLGGRGLDTSVVNAYYDRVFGTIAVRVVPSGTDVVAGDLAADSTSSTASAQTAQAMELRSIVRSVPRSVQDARVTTIVPAGMGVSSPIAGRILTLTAAGRTYRTTTDERGHYVFRIPHSATATEATIAVDRSSLTQKITLSAPRLTVPLIRVR